MPLFVSMMMWDHGAWKPGHVMQLHSVNLVEQQREKPPEKHNQLFSAVPYQIRHASLTVSHQRGVRRAFRTHSCLAISVWATREHQVESPVQMMKLEFFYKVCDKTAMETSAVASTRTRCIQWRTVWQGSVELFHLTSWCCSPCLSVIVWVSLTGRHSSI